MSTAISEQRKQKRLEADDIAKIKELRHVGVSIDVIAQRFHVEPGVVRMVLRLHD